MEFLEPTGALNERRVARNEFGPVAPALGYQSLQPAGYQSLQSAGYQSLQPDGTYLLPGIITSLFE
ncbi:hypothetical protein D8S78_11360 [Natrialba swarupiae]|nr:hypothetical protein [Natrialba swarupiae]